MKLKKLKPRFDLRSELILPNEGKKGYQVLAIRWGWVVNEYCYLFEIHGVSKWIAESNLTQLNKLKS